MADVEFFWDTVSPYTYLAATRLDALVQRTGARVVWRPFFLGGVMQATGNRPPAQVPAKGRWMLQDLHAWSAKWGVSFAFPPVFPANTLRAQRMAVVADRAGLGPAFGMRILTAYWAEQKDPSEPDVLRAEAAAVGGDGDVWLAATEDPEIKAALKAQTDEAVERGAFGAPSFFVGDRLFWGSDRFELLEDALLDR